MFAGKKRMGQRGLRERVSLFFSTSCLFSCVCIGCQRRSGARWWCVQLSLGAIRMVGSEIWVDWFVGCWLQLLLRTWSTICGGVPSVVHWWCTICGAQVDSEARIPGITMTVRVDSGSGFGLVPVYTTLSVRVRANIQFGALKIKRMNPIPVN